MSDKYFNLLTSLIDADPRKGNLLVGMLYDKVYETEEWISKLPYLSFPAHWKVRIIPPFVGAVIRFQVRASNEENARQISIYFDGYNNLGYFPEKGGYWEIYPAKDGDVDRFALGEEEEMLKAVGEALEVNRD